MNDWDLLTVCMAGLSYLDKKEEAFVLSVKRRLPRTKALTLAQNTYLQALYDKIVTEEYRLEPVSKPHDYFRKKNGYGG